MDVEFVPNKLLHPLRFVDNLKSMESLRPGKPNRPGKPDGPNKPDKHFTSIAYHCRAKKRPEHLII